MLLLITWATDLIKRTLLDTKHSFNGVPVNNFVPSKPSFHEWRRNLCRVADGHRHVWLIPVMYNRDQLNECNPVLERLRTAKRQKMNWRLIRSLWPTPIKCGSSAWSDVVVVVVIVYWIYSVFLKRKKKVKYTTCAVFLYRESHCVLMVKGQEKTKYVLYISFFPAFLFMMEANTQK